MKFGELSGSELEIMKVLWKNDEAMSFGEILTYFDKKTDKSWKKQTLNTFLFRMQQKGLLEVMIEGRYKKYAPAITEKEYKLVESKTFLDRNYQGSIINMLSAFNGGEILGKNEINELKQLLEEWENK